MTLKEHMNIGRRLIKLLYSLSRRYFYFLICASVVKAVTPYIPIWFSARLIDALAEGAPLATLVTYAALTVGLSTVLGVLRIGSTRRRRSAAARSWRVTSGNTPKRRCTFPILR